MDKEQLRLKLQECLRRFDAEQISRKSQKACRNLIATSQFQAASVIMMYLAIPYEADTTEAITQAWQLGKTVVVPKVSWKQKNMEAVKINSIETGFSTGASGLRNPRTGMPMPLEKIDLVVTPALAFDGKGNVLENKWTILMTAKRDISKLDLTINFSRKFL